MADENENNEENELPEGGPASGASSKKKKLFFGGGFVSVIAAGAITALMAVPSNEAKPRFKGPFTTPLLDETFNCNLLERAHYLRMEPEVMYQVYDPTYFTTRTADQLYLPQLKNAMQRVAASKAMEDVFGEANQTGFMEEMSEALGPIIFPVHIGDSTLPWDPDEDSGLRPGLSTDKTSFRGNFYDHVLRVDATAGTLQIDGGPLSNFDAGSPDVRVMDANGSVLYVDVSDLAEDFIGEVPIGVQGRIITILPLDLIIQ
jgi:hypothetical protein